MNRALGGMCLTLVFLLFIGGSGYMQSLKLNGSLRQAVEMVSVGLQESEAEKKLMRERHSEDQRLIADLDGKRRALLAESVASQKKTARELQDAQCADTDLPKSIADRLWNRIHRQAGKYTRAPPA